MKKISYFILIFVLIRLIFLVVTVYFKTNTDYSALKNYKPKYGSLFDKKYNNANKKHNKSKNELKPSKASKNWIKYEISNAFKISIPPQLELRTDSSAYNQTMDNIRKNFNPKHTIKISKSNLIFQPKGTDKFYKEATKDITRIFILYNKNNHVNFPKWNFTTNEKELTALNEILKKNITKGLKELPFEKKILKWYPIKFGKISSGLSYFKISYIGIAEKNKFITNTYQFFNTDEKAIITFSTNYSKKDKWEKRFNEIIETFDFKHRK